jgi:hypothetical protein
MTTTLEQTFRELFSDRRKFIESLLMIEDKQRQRVPFVLNPIQQDAMVTETGRDIYVKPAQVGFSSLKLAERLIDTITVPGTNTVLIAYEDFITERLLSKTEFFYNHLAALEIPGFPTIYHDSTYEKTFRFYINGKVASKSSMYIASARSYVAGRAETIHHLLCDEFAFWAIGAKERIFMPAADRVPPDGTIDVFSTPNGEDNDFCEMYQLAKEGSSVFASHFYPWFIHPEYVILLGDSRIRHIPETNVPEFRLSQDEEQLAVIHRLTFDQIRWRRWKLKEKESFSRTGETRMLFLQEFPEDDVSCFLATGDMFYNPIVVNELARKCYPATIHRDGMDIWYPPEAAKHYIVTIDPGQAKVTQTAITVLMPPQPGNDNWKYCARDAGLYSLEPTVAKAKEAAKYYNGAMITWEANSHGLGIAPLMHYGNVYYRRDVVSGRVSSEPGWLTTPRTKDYMLASLHRMLPDMVVYDIEFVSELRNIRQVGNKAISVGADDIHDSVAIGIVCNNPNPTQRGFMGKSGWKW